MRIRSLVIATVAGLALTVPAAAPASAHTGGSHGHHQPPATDWTTQVVDADQSFRGLAAVDRRTAWLAGESLTDGGPGKVYRTGDGGRHWADVSPAGTAGLAFRDVEVTGRHSASVLAIGPGDASRIYRTGDDGRHWTEAFRNPDANAFYDCMAFYPGGRVGLAMSDPVDNRFRIARTVDGGRSWHVLPSSGMPDSTGQAGFAASGDCLVTTGRDAYFGGGGTAAKIYHSRDLGRTWTATDSTIPTGDAAGVFGLAFRTPWQGVAVGGNFSDPTNGKDATAVTRNGRSWTNAGDLTQLAEAAKFLPHTWDAVLATGESGTTMGTDLSLDGGRSWIKVSTTGFHALDCTWDGTCWAAGGHGRVGTWSYGGHR